MAAFGLRRRHGEVGMQRTHPLAKPSSKLLAGRSSGEPKQHQQGLVGCMCHHTGSTVASARPMMKHLSCAHRPLLGSSRGQRPRLLGEAKPCVSERIERFEASSPLRIESLVALGMGDGSDAHETLTEPLHASMRVVRDALDDVPCAVPCHDAEIAQARSLGVRLHGLDEPTPQVHAVVPAGLGQFEDTRRVVSMKRSEHVSEGRVTQPFGKVHAQSAS